MSKYKKIDPEKGDVLNLNQFHNQPPPAYSSHGPLKADFETAIELTGYGRFHYILLTICGLVSTSEVTIFQLLYNGYINNRSNF